MHSIQGRSPFCMNDFIPHWSNHGSKFRWRSGKLSYIKKAAHYATWVKSVKNVVKPCSLNITTGPTLLQTPNMVNVDTQQFALAVNTITHILMMPTCQLQKKSNSTLNTALSYFFFKPIVFIRSLPLDFVSLPSLPI